MATSSPRALAVLALAACCFLMHSAEASGTAGGSNMSALEYSLKLDAAEATQEAVPLLFTLRHQGSRPLWVLRWQTPLEGLKGDLFTVRCDGRNLDYRGRLIKRAAPTGDDYVRLDAGDVVQARVDLAKAYTIPKRASCVVVFKGPLLDVRSADPFEGPMEPLMQPMEIDGQGLDITIGASGR